MRHYHRRFTARLCAVVLGLFVAGCGGTSAGLTPAPVGATGGALPVRGLESDASGCRYSKSVVNFEKRKIRIGDWLWFTSIFSVGRERRPLHFEMKNSSILFSNGRRSIIVKAPDASITLSSRNRVRLAYLGNHNVWSLVAPVGMRRGYFLDAVPYHVKYFLPADVRNATWTAQFVGEHADTIDWQWGAAVYTRFADVADRLHVKPLGDRRFAPRNGDPPGTPEAYRPWLIPGGTGNGHREYIGKLSDIVAVQPCR